MNERGAVAVFVAVLILPLALLLSFAIDTGNWWLHHRHLQTQVDAAAFAGGDRFFECFRPNADPTVVWGDMQNEANRYVGLPTSAFNGQVGNANKGSLSVLYNSKTYPGQSSTAPPNQTPDDTITVSTQDVCQSQMFDVKSSEAGLPTFFGTLPGFSSVPYINAHARVQLRQIQSGKGSLPLAVPDVSPKSVDVTFINQTAGGGALANCSQPNCTFPLTKATTSGGVTYWTGTASLSVPDAYTDIGMRVGLGSSAGSCAGTSGVAGQYACYDNSSATASLVVIRGYRTVGTGTPGAPVERAVWEQTTNCGINSGSPFFSDVSGQTSCNETVQAVIDFGGAAANCPNVCVFANGNAMTYANGIWSASFSLAEAAGATPVSLTWSNTSATCGKKACKNQAFSNPPDQQGYGADSDYGVTGPVKVVSLSENSSASGAPYSLAPGTHSLTVTVGVQGNLESMPVPSPTTFLRFQVNGSNSITTAVQCDPGGNNAFTDSLQNGCQTRYQINPTGSCNPDPAPAGPADCVPTRNGNLGTTVNKALNARFGCPTNKWPSSYTQSDPRIVQLMITNFSNLIGSGNTLVPVDNYATFYVTGWSGASCAANEPAPGPLPQNADGYIWGHFIQYTNGADTPGKTLCSQPGNNVIPCVPVLIQ